MATVFSILVALILLAGSSLGIRQVHAIFPKPTWLPVVLALFFALPLVLAALKMKEGRSGVRAFLRTLFATAAGVLVLTLVYQRWTTNWIWACLAGVVVTGIIGMIQASQMMQAQLNLNQALEAFNASRFQDALKQAQLALDVAVARGERAVAAEAEFLAGLCYNQLGESVRAARYLTRSRADFGPKGPKPRLEQISQVLSQLRISGVDTAASAESAEEGVSEGLTGQVAINTLLATAAIMTCLKLWGLPALQASVAVLVFVAAVVFLLVAVGYFAADLILARGNRRSLFLLLPLNALGLLIAAAGVLGMLARNAIVSANGFPPAIRPVASKFLAMSAEWPGWGLPTLIAVGAATAFLTLMAATGRSPLGVFRGLSQGGSDDKSLRLARAHLDAGEWSKAVVQLSRIDLVNEKNVQKRAETLFLLAFAHHKAEHPNEAAEHVAEMLEIVPDSREGLYLAGYLALTADQLEKAEGHWRRLHSLSPGYCPADQKKANRSATYFLCLTLYRRAMAMMAQDVEQGAQVLGEVGRLGALDREASDALVRVHLHRFVELIRRNDWTKAAQEAELAEGKLAALAKTEVDPADMAKIRGFALAAQGLTAAHREQYREAAGHFAGALEATKSLRPTGSFGGSGGTLLEQMLRALMEGVSDDARSINPGFPRDCGLLAAITELHRLRDEGVRGKELRAALSAVQTPLNDGLAASPDAPEILALLGLLWYHLGADDDMQEKGIEALQRVRERVASKFVSETLAEYENDRQVLKDARQAYFELLQQHLQSADVPLQTREALQAEVVERLRARGQYEAFLGRGGLDVNAAEEPSVREYVNRAHLLDVKVRQALQTRRAAGVSPQVAELIDRLNAQNQSLQQTIGSITDLEMQILHEALDLM